MYLEEGQRIHVWAQITSSLWSDLSTPLPQAPGSGIKDRGANELFRACCYVLSYRPEQSFCTYLMDWESSRGGVGCATHLLRANCWAAMLLQGLKIPGCYQCLHHWPSLQLLPREFAGGLYWATILEVEEPRYTNGVALVPWVVRAYISSCLLLGSIPKLTHVYPLPFLRNTNVLMKSGNTHFSPGSV